jgi:thymidylate synthase (FAD)
LKVTPVAHTMIDWDNLAEVIPGTKFFQEASEEFDTVSSADHLGEFAGRTCYQAFERKNPDTATTAGYLANIIDRGHYSVLEHASVTFYVQDVSRSMLLELERHTFLSFSVESQRYVNQVDSHPAPVVPPLFDEMPATGPYRDLLGHYSASLSMYERAVEYAIGKGYSRKQAREAARSFLPNCTGVNLVVTGNLRCWRDVLGKRYHVAADAEIRGFATEVLKHLREIAPLSVQDIPEQPYQ